MFTVGTLVENLLVFGAKRLNLGFFVLMLEVTHILKIF